MRKLLLGMLIALPATLATPASALPGAAHDGLPQSDLIQIKGGGGHGHGHGWGRGHGHGHGWGRGHGHRAFGWSQGRKVGWRGRGCPPGLWRQGRC